MLDMLIMIKNCDQDGLCMVLSGLRPLVGFVGPAASVSAVSGRAWALGQGVTSHREVIRCASQVSVLGWTCCCQPVVHLLVAAVGGEA